MDIQYLLLLQEFRCSINDAWTPFMEWISHFAVTYLLIVPTFIYWCVDKKKGLYILASFSLARAVNAVVKLTACAYRPWIRDARVIPAGCGSGETAPVSEKIGIIGAMDLVLDVLGRVCYFTFKAPKYV